MEIKVNDKVVRIFKGAKVEDVIRKYSEEILKQVINGEKRVVDRKGHPVSLSGELTGGEILWIK